MKSKFYILSTVVLLIVIGFMAFESINKESTSASSTGAIDMGEYQKVVLTMKNYNYYPNNIEVNAGKPVRIYLDDSIQGCYRSFTMPAFNIKKNLISKDDYVEFTPTDKGTFKFACSMGMGKGTVTVN